jgi:hypothetical protein
VSSIAAQYGEWPYAGRVLEASRRRILQTVADDALILDVGGWAVPFPRADWVIDLAPYETRGAWGYDGEPDAERFTAQTYVQRDICDREPWPFEDGRFDFVICSHTLEDVRDPVWVCSEIVRVGRAGYVEVPSRLVEQSRGVQGDWVGWSHHHWLVDVDQEDPYVRFVLKPHELSRRDADIAFPEGAAARLAPEEQVSCLWWEGEFGFGEHVFYEVAEQHAYLREAIESRPDLATPRRRRR